jgi:hypothetical protein
MKTDTEFEEFYQKSILLELEKLECQRKRVLSTLTLFLILVIAVVIYCIAYIDQTGGNPVFALFAGAVLIFLGYGYLRRAYVAAYKQKVMRKIVRFVDEGLDFSGDKGMPKSTFMESRICLSNPTRYESEDRVSGKIGDTRIAFSEVRAWIRQGRSEGKIFAGIFFVADFNKSFNAVTLVLPETAEKLFGQNIGTWLQSHNFERPPLVKLEDPQFEKLFVVYGEDQVEARYILSPSLMERLVKLKGKIRDKVYVSFVKNRIIVAVAYDGNLFEPNLLEPVTSLQTTEAYFQVVRFFAGIVEDLNLNTRIWGKE